MAYMMRNGVDFEVDLGSHIGVLRGDGAGRQTSARGKGWHGWVRRCQGTGER